MKTKGMTKKSATVMEWMEGELERDAALRADVQAMMNAMNIEQDIAALREKLGLTQAQLARRMGVTQPLVARIERGTSTNLGIRTLVRMAAALGAKVQITITEDALARRPKHLGKIDRPSKRKLAKVP